MGKKVKLTLIVLLGLIALIYSAYLFLIPAIFDLNNFKPQIIKTVKDSSGLEIKPGNLKIHTSFDFKAAITAEKVEIKHLDNKPLLKLEQASVKFDLLPLLFKKLNVTEVNLSKPEVFLTKFKDDKYDIEEILKNIEQKQKKIASSTENKQTMPIAPVFKALNVIINNYKINITDQYYSPEKHFVIKGDIFKITDFNPEKFIKIVTKGQFFIENIPSINYDLAVSCELPLDAELKRVLFEQESEDPLKGLVKYDFKGDITTDIKLTETKTEKFPKINGLLKFDKVSIKIDGQKLPDNHGALRFADKKIEIDSKLYITTKSFFEIAGKINDFQKQDFDINVKSSEIMLTDVKKFIYSFADAFNTDVSKLNDLALSGKFIADFNLKKNNYRGYLNILETSISHKEISQSLKNFNGRLNFDKDKIVFNSTSGYFGDAKFNVTGFIASKNYSDVKITSPTVNLKTIFDIINNSKLFATLKPQIKDFTSVSGNISLEAIIKGDLNKEIAPKIAVGLSNISLYHSPSKLPILVSSGNITSDSEKANLKGINALISSTPLNISGEITELKKTPAVNITVKGQISSADIKKNAPKEFKHAVNAENNIPLTAQINGTAENLNLAAQLNLKNIANIIKFDQPKGTENIVNISANVKPNSILLDNTGLFAGSGLLKTPSGFYNLKPAGQLVSANGFINNYNSSKPILNDFKVNVSGLNLVLSQPKGKVQVNGNLVLSGTTLNPKAVGSLNIKNLHIPSMYFKTSNVNIALKNDEILVSSDDLNIVNSKLVVTAALKNKLSPPYEVKTIKINSDFLNIDKINAAFISSSRSSGMAQSNNIPLIIHNGSFLAKKLVVNNLLNEDLAFNFSINPVNMLKLNNFLTHTAGGTISGVFDASLKTTKINLDLMAENVEINALATNFAKMPNQVFGGMKGRIKLATSGQTPEAMTQNAVGKVDFSITNGHLVKLGSLEFLLGAKNLFSKGLTGSILSNTLKFDEAKKTNHFDSLDAMVLVNKGMLDIREMKMKGKYLSSFISGTIQMNNNYANMTVLSKLSGRIMKNLGPVADISFDKLLRQIPGQWGELLAEQRLVNQYPNRDKIPALNAEPLSNDRDFAVKISGNLNQAFAVTMFEWLPASNIPTIEKTGN
ncbi:MAG TPA: AsmA-like C-terminal region-containing protein [Candidatus Gastranaerophilales bacterium]|nr:AsmA-like C-terminal region-containing protein [Candidatus Gastranaerophilales bacterium]